MPGPEIELMPDRAAEHRADPGLEAGLGVEQLGVGEGDVTLGWQPSQDPIWQ